MKSYTRKVFDTTTNRYFYNKIYKRLLSKKYGFCGRCGWHSGENLNKCYPRYLKSWKKKSKRKHQYKIIDLPPSYKR